jgi:hypothetical protein
MDCELGFDSQRSGVVAHSQLEEPRSKLVPRSELELELEPALHSKLAPRSLVVFRLKTSR